MIRSRRASDRSLETLTTMRPPCATFRLGRMRASRAPLIGLLAALALGVASCGDDDDDEIMPPVDDELTCTASASDSSGVAPLTVMFQGAAAGGVSPYVFSWAFGDGDSSAEQNPSHEFATADTFEVMLTVIDSRAPADTCRQTLFVSVEVPPMRNTPVSLVESWLEAAYESRDSLMYEDALHEEFAFEFLPQDADSLGDFWGKTLDLVSTGAMFRSSDVAEIAFDLMVTSNTQFVDANCIGCRLLETVVAIDVTFDEPAGDPLVLTIDSPQTFVVARDPGDTALWMLWRQTDILPGSARAIRGTGASAPVEAISWGGLKGRFR